MWLLNRITNLMMLIACYFRDQLFISIFLLCGHMNEYMFNVRMECGSEWFTYEAVVDLILVHYMIKVAWQQLQIRDLITRSIL